MENVEPDNSSETPENVISKLFKELSIDHCQMTLKPGYTMWTHWNMNTKKLELSIEDSDKRDRAFTISDDQLDYLCYKFLVHDNLIDSITFNFNSPLKLFRKMSVTHITMGVFQDLHKNEFEMLAKQVFPEKLIEVPCAATLKPASFTKANYREQQLETIMTANVGNDNQSVHAMIVLPHQNGNTEIIDSERSIDVDDSCLPNTGKWLELPMVEAVEGSVTETEDGDVLIEL